MKYKTREQSQQETLKKRLDAMQTPRSTDPAAFDAACGAFKEVCAQIKEFAGFDDFKGGFEEAMAFLQCAAFAADKAQGTYLFSLWQGADKAVTYEAGKIGLGQPEWWYRCWGLEMPEA